MAKNNSLLPISVFIIAVNEADRISPTINSVKEWVDEVIVVDSGSTDSTVKVAKKLGARVIFNEWDGYGPQKAFGEGLCKNDWILNLDADEEVSKKLKQHIIELFTKQKLPEHSGYYVKVRMLPRFKKKVSLLSPYIECIRLYNKTKASFKKSKVHDSVQVHEGSTGRLRGYFIHRSIRSWEHAIGKLNYYSSLQAEDLLAKNSCPLVMRIIFEPFFSFIKYYFIRRYFVFGIDGFVQAMIYSFTRFLRLAKARDLFREKNHLSRRSKINN